MKSFWVGLTIYILVTHFILPLHAQLPDFHITQTNEINSEPITNIYSIVEDEEGFLWMGGRYGLFRYDGTTFTSFYSDPANPYSIPFGTIIKIIKSQRGGLWLASDAGGFGYFDLATEKAFCYGKDSGNPSGLQGEQVQGILEDQSGDIWIGTNNFTLHKLSKDSSTFEIYRPPLPVSSGNYALAGSLGEIISDVYDPDVLWIGSRFGIYCFNKKELVFQLYPFSKPIEYWYRPLNVELFMDDRGTIWAGGWETGLLSLDFKNEEWVKHPGSSIDKPFEAGRNTVEDIISYDDSLILSLTLIDGLEWLNIEDGMLHSGPSPVIFGTPYPLNLLGGMLSKKGDLWIGANSAFLKLSGSEKPFPNLYFADLNHKINKSNWQRAYVLAPSGHELYIGTLRGNGLLIWDFKHEKLDAISYKELRHQDDTDVLYDDLCFDNQHKLWIGSDEGLLYLSADHKAILPFDSDVQSLRAGHISTLSTSGNQLWIGTRGDGIYVVDLATEKVIDHHLKLRTINKILADSLDRIWIGAEEGLWCYQPGNQEFHHFIQQTDDTPGLGRTTVTDLALDEHRNLWIATNGGGLNFLISDSDLDHPQFDLYLNEGIPGANIIHEVEVGRNSTIWLGTDSGISGFEPADKVFVNYDYRDEMFPKIGAMICLPDGRIVSADFQSFHLFDPATLMGVSGPEAYLRNFRVFDKKIVLDKPINHLASISLTSWQNHFSLELGAINFTEHARNIFAYQLLGYDQDWVYSGSRDYVSYTNLPAGTFQFNVKAANQHYRWSDDIKTLEITINPPFWNTWWFRAAASLLLAFTAYQVIHFFRKKKLTKERQKAVDYFANSTYSGASVDEILWDLMRNCIARLKLEVCSIYLVDDHNQLVQTAAFGPKNKGFRKIENPLVIPVGDRIVGTVAKTGVGEIINDTGKDERYLIDDRIRNSEMAVPIIHNQKVIGVIDSEHSRKGFFKNEDLQLISTIASLCANKIIRAKSEMAVKEQEKQLLALDRDLSEAQLIALRAQMNPHFLFNCLNSINWYIIKNRAREASRYLTKFSRLIRLILDHSKSQNIYLSQELEALQLYIELEAMRFDNKFNLKLEVDPTLNLDEIEIAPMILQPYVENAIWHGLMHNQKDENILSIKLYPEMNVLHCIISDNGIGRAEALKLAKSSLVTHESKGMKITSERISMLNRNSDFHEQVLITDLYDEIGRANGTRVHIKLNLA